MYILLGDMYGTMYEEGALQAPEVAQAFQRWVCPAMRSPYINWMLHDATVTIQAIRPYGLGMFSGDLLEGSNRVLKCNYEAKRHSPTCFGMQPNHGGCLLCCYTGYLGIFSSFLV